MMSFKPLHNRARENGAEWYQIFLAEKLTAEAGGDRDLFLFLLELFKENESGHLRIELDDAGRDILDKYSGYFHSPRSPFVLTGDDRYLYTKRRKAQEDEFLERFETLLSRENHPLVDGDDSFIIQAGAEKGLELSPPVREACLKVNGESFYIVTGGPGTGKTTALAGIIQTLCLAAEKRGSSPLKIALAAPTGRAAKRMEQSLAGQDEAGPASTLHKLLKIRFDSGEPGYDRDNPLPADLVVIDEASMVDLRMMSLLFDALPPRGHLLLVGDKDQLPSVEAGALFADFLHRADEEGHRLHNRVLMLRKIYRSNREIITLAGKIIEGRTAEAVELLKKSEGEGAVRYRSLSERTEPLYREVSAFYGEVRPFLSEGFPEKINEWKKRTKSLEGLFDLYNDRIILCPSRKGLAGVERLNREIRERLFSRSLHGVPVMMTSNDYDLELFNGDRGVICVFAGEPHVFFPGEEDYRHIPLTYLENWEYSWVQTIHKSQGSEFREVTVILPPGAERLLSREILYTALTRAREKVSLFSDFPTLENCVARGITRNSRIKEVLSAGLSPA